MSDIPAPANYTDRMVAVDELKNETWNYLKKDLSDVIGIYRTKRGVGTLPPALNPNHSLYRSWLLLKERLQARSETWNVWIEWYEFRFLGKTSSKVPNGLWKSIENKLCLRHDFMSSDDVTTINGIFAEQILEEVEALVDYQASVEFSQTAPSVTVSNGTIEISDPPTARLSGQNHIAFSELQDALNAMKAECDKNSASHLKDDIDSYDNSFGSTGWENPIPFAIRGDRLRRLLDIHLAKDAGSDIPDISDQTLFCFQNLVRAHNFAVSIHPDTRKIDDQLNEGLRGLDSDPLEIFREISRIYQAKVVIDKNSRETLDFLRKGIDADSDSASKVLLAFGFIGNVVQSASGWIWRNRKALAAGSVTLGGALLATAKWMLAQEAWLLANFSVNSQIGALLRSVLEILKSLPI
ncbi:hypothetical protein [Citromicrobium bathyomarinum]|uniref:hypothetical protein n=1 Tax=Citromicrobium bathyomarinum TaxID=72174 RepID=UPI001E526A70|nr:hypothetical protein [Citromicrobium bathyomarinum]MCD1621821.1 hypothetical protein [Citromicrobium bathyomarinum]